MSNRFAAISIIALLIGTSLTSEVSNAADIRQVKWRFTLIVGPKQDADFGQKKPLCIPTNHGFITKIPAIGGPSFTDDLMQDSERILTLDVADVAPPQSETCSFHYDSHESSSGQKCVDFWIDKGPRGAQVCQGQWELRAVIGK